MQWSTQGQAALISAITAAIVTLLIEYAVKPRLEARKDRIISQNRTLRKLQVELLDCIQDASMLLLGSSTTTLNKMRSQFPELQTRIRGIQKLAITSESGLRGKQRELVTSSLNQVSARLFVLDDCLDMYVQAELKKAIEEGNKEVENLELPMVASFTQRIMLEIARAAQAVETPNYMFWRYRRPWANPNYTADSIEDAKPSNPSDPH